MGKKTENSSMDKKRCLRVPEMGLHCIIVIVLYFHIYLIYSYTELIFSHIRRHVI